MIFCTINEKWLWFSSFSITHPVFLHKKFDSKKLAGSNCLNPFVIQTWCIFVRIMCLLLCMIVYAVRNLPFWRKTFYFDFLRFFTKPFILPKINSVATWYLIGPLKTSIYISCIILSISCSTMNEKFNFKISDSSNGRHPV